MSGWKPASLKLLGSNQMTFLPFFAGRPSKSVFPLPQTKNDKVPLYYCCASLWEPQKATRETYSVKCKSKVYYHAHIQANRDLVSIEARGGTPPF